MFGRPLPVAGSRPEFANRSCSVWCVAGLVWAAPSPSVVLVGQSPSDAAAAGVRRGALLLAGVPAVADRWPVRKGRLLTVLPGRQGSRCRARRPAGARIVHGF